MKVIRHAELVGQTFARLTITGVFRKVVGCRTRAFFKCKCSCGKKIEAVCGDVIRGKHRSCGCLHIDVVTKHGGGYTAEHRLWVAMRQRCENPNAAHYDRYGARGIRVCDRWQSFANFMADMGPRPAKYTVDRIDNNGNYEPNNCRWATRKEQAQNRQHTAKARICYQKRARNELGQFA